MDQSEIFSEMYGTKKVQKNGHCSAFSQLSRKLKADRKPSAPKHTDVRQNGCLLGRGVSLNSELQHEKQVC